MKKLLLVGLIVGLGMSAYGAYEYVDGEMNKVDSKMKELSKRIGIEKGRNTRQKKQINENKKRIEDLEESASAAYDYTDAEVGRVKGEMKTEVNKLSRRIGTQKGRITKYAKDIKENTKTLEEHKGELDKAEKERKALSKKISTQKGRITKYAKNIKANTATLKDHETRLGEVEQEVKDSFDFALEHTDVAVSELRGEVKEDIKSLSRRIGTEKRRNTLQNKKLKQHEDRMTDIEDSIEENLDYVLEHTDDRIDEVKDRADAMDKVLENHADTLADHERRVEKNENNIAQNRKAIEDEVEARKAADQNHQRAIKELRHNTESGLAAVAAMAVMDFREVPVGKVGVGAAVGGYRGRQAVSVGVAHSPKENLNFNGKVGIPTSDIQNSTYGVGVTYWFK